MANDNVYYLGGRHGNGVAFAIISGNQGRPECDVCERPFFPGEKRLDLRSTSPDRPAAFYICRFCGGAELLGDYCQHTGHDPALVKELDDGLLSYDQELDANIARLRAPVAKATRWDTLLREFRAILDREKNGPMPPELA